MTTLLPPKHSALVAVLLLFSAALLATASTAKADTITYSIVDYPQAEIDVLNGYQDKVSGTITASAAGTLGSYTAGSFGLDNPALVSLTYTIKIESSDPSLPVSSTTYSGSDLLSDHLGSGTVTFTSEAILLYGYMGINGTGDGGSGWLAWRPDDSNYYQGLVIPPYPSPEFKFLASPAIPGYMGAAPWIIGTAPEPGTLALLGVGAISLSAFGWLRRKRG